ncbi:MAG: hypothetical protein HN352_16860 [Bacteroidetes bacterium]|jgi:hypothetical protein|nr:hypothetical protein [Bacteroidota bacterium]MBT4401319.1 hypothetical protein [Bacteroidota bacterium]MBT4411580.1 hypothetical protein [Bacteroidota bacterium]MBT7464005.1 hypothetical protein [Bacteroidota bacterium]
MLSILKYPPTISLTGNPSRFILESDNHLSSAGTKAAVSLNFTAPGLANESFILSWDSIEVEIMCKANPDNSGNQIPDNTVFPVLADWIQAVATQLTLNYYLAKDFVITSGSTSVIFTAREFGSKYALSWTKSWSDPEPLMTITGGFDQVPQVFFKVGVLVDLFIGSDYQNIAEELLPVDLSGQVTIDIHKFFADRLFSEFTFPESSDNLIVLQENSCRPYRIRAYERYGEDLRAQKLIVSDQYHVLNAGISHLQEAIYNRQDSSFWEKLTYNNYFLTWQPKTKTVDRYQIEKLYFLVQSSIPSLVLKVKTYLTSGIVSTDIISSLVDPIVKSVYEIILTPNTLQIAGYDDGTLKKFDAWLEDGADNRISEIRNFAMDTLIHENVRYFLFLNSLGGFDTLRITGDQEDSLEYSRTSIKKILGDAFTEKDHQTTASNILERKRYSANTGWKTREDIAWIRDFFLSKQVYLINTGKLVPVEITTTDALQRKDRSEMYSIQFDYQRAYSSAYYTKELVAADFNDDFIDDFANE